MEIITLPAKIRESIGRKTKVLRKRGILPAVLYGPRIKSQPIEIDLKEFKKIYNKVGESSLISLQIKKLKKDEKSDKEEKKNYLVLIHDIKENPLNNEITHVDFYQPILTEEVEVTVPLVFEGIAPAVKDLGGTLVKEIREVKVKALPQNLPHDIKTNIEGLKTFDDEILIKDLNIPRDVKILREPNEIVALVVPPTKVEEELAKPIEEKVEEVEKVEEKKEKEETEEKEEKVEETVVKPKEKKEE